MWWNTISHCDVCRGCKIRLEYKVEDYLSLVLDSMYVQHTLQTLPPLSSTAFAWPVGGQVPILTQSQKLLSRFFPPKEYIKRRSPWEQNWDSILQLESQFIWSNLFPKGTNEAASGMGTLGHKSGFVAWSFVTSLGHSVPGSLRATGFEKWLANKALAPGPPHL